MEPVLSVKNLTVSYENFTLHPISFTINAGEIYAIIGESGSGKTTLAKAISGLLGKGDNVSGHSIINGNNITALTEKERKRFRMIDFSVVFQNSAEWLNPSMRLSEQLSEVLIKRYPKNEHPTRKNELMEEVGLTPEVLRLYPGQLSGGMTQKFLLASALALRPKLVILDEPTSSLDLDYIEEFTSLIKKMNQNYRTAFLVITHDLRLAAQLSTQLVVLYQGYVVETGETDAILSEPRHPYTRGLINAAVSLNMLRDMWGIRSAVNDNANHGCSFWGRCTQSIEVCETIAPTLTDIGNKRCVACHRGGIVRILHASGVYKSFGKNEVLRDISLSVFSGEVVSLIGHSGAGKTTLSLIVSGFLRSDAGRILFQNTQADFDLLHKSIGGIQTVFQDSEQAINPIMRVWDAITEPLRLAEETISKEAISTMLFDVGLSGNDEFVARRINTLSGGEKQRVSIARALIMQPRLLIADEPTSMLDPSTKANLLRMLKQLQNQQGFSMLIVTHDLASAAKISDRVYLLKDKILTPVNIAELVNQTYLA